MRYSPKSKGFMMERAPRKSRHSVVNEDANRGILLKNLMKRLGIKRKYGAEVLKSKLPV